MAKLLDIKDRAVNKSLIDQIEKMLSQAKSGELRSIFYVKGWDNDNVSHGWCMDSRNNRRMILAEMVMATHDMTVNIELQDKDSVLTYALGMNDIPK